MEGQLPAPQPDQAYFEVSALEGGFLTFPAHYFLTNTPESDVIYNCPSLPFLLRHSHTKKPILFDLGVAQCVPDNFAIMTKKGHLDAFAPIRVPKAISQVLREGATNPEDVRTIILSHVHWDQ